MKQTHTSNASDLGVNTWLVVLTSERFLFLDHALLTKSVDTQSIRHDRVQAVSASQGWVLGKITVDIGARTIVIDNCQKATVAPMASLANKWLAVLQKRKDEPSAAGSVAASSALDEMKKLAELHSMGALTDEEFAAAKAKLLASL
jgi:arginine utilization protein RocB